MKATNNLLQHLIDLIEENNPDGETFLKEGFSVDKECYSDEINTLRSSAHKKIIRACEQAMRGIWIWQNQIKHPYISSNPSFHSKPLNTERLLTAFQPKQIEALELLEWHYYLVPAKTRRAVSALEEAINETGELRMICQRDADGSAKVALLGIDDCIISLLSLYSDWPEEEDNILVFLTNLSKVKALLLDEFPDAMNFIRPGFDTNAE